MSARTRLVIAVVAILALGGVVTAVLVHRTDGRQAAAAYTTSSFGGRLVALRHPASWRYVGPEGLSMGDGAVVGYLTTANTVSQCATSDGGSSVSCHSPVPKLSGRDVLVTVVAVGLATSGFGRANGTVSGYPVRYSSDSPAEDGCPAGALRAEQVMIDTQSSGTEQRLDITGCFAAGGTSIADFERMVRTAKIP